MFLISAAFRLIRSPLEVGFTIYTAFPKVLEPTNYSFCPCLTEILNGFDVRHWFSLLVMKELGEK
jgi:hypothetical protein